MFCVLFIHVFFLCALNKSTQTRESAGGWSFFSLLTQFTKSTASDEFIAHQRAECQHASTWLRQPALAFDAITSKFSFEIEIVELLLGKVQNSKHCSALARRPLSECLTKPYKKAQIFLPPFHDCFAQSLFKILYDLFLIPLEIFSQVFFCLLICWLWWLRFPRRVSHPSTGLWCMIIRRSLLCARERSELKNFHFGLQKNSFFFLI